MEWADIVYSVQYVTKDGGRTVDGPVSSSLTYLAVASVNDTVDKWKKIEVGNHETD